MPRKRKLSNLGDRCRFCLARDACMSELFADWLKPKLDDLQKISGLQILDKANYPRKICYVCLYKLEMWNEFKGQFLKTNKTLITHFKIVEESVPEVNKSLDTAQDTVDDLLSDDDKKRPKIDSSNVISELRSTLKTPEKAKLEKTDEIELLDNEENTLSSLSKNQLSDNSAANHRKGRLKKIEREASTKRWEERKNALIAATGEIPSESESDNGSQLSPVQKARVKARNIEMELERQKKIQKALKNLQTDLTEKYKVSFEEIATANERKTRSRQDSIGTNERKTRSQQMSKSYTEEIHVIDNVKVNLLKSPLAEKKLEMLNILKKEKEKEDEVEKEKEVEVEKEKEEKNMGKKKEGRKIETVHLGDESVIDITEEVHDQSNEIQVIENKSNNKLEKESEKKSENKAGKVPITSMESDELSPEPLKKSKNMIVNKKPENNIDVIDLEDEVENIVDINISENQSNKTLFNPQQVKSEVTLGNATYVVTTTLDLPGSAPVAKGDISLKTNGLNIDTTSQDGNKIDIMNAVQLQKVQSKEDGKEKNKSGNEGHTCLKIEIEGMEVQALQRVQLDLAHFVTNEVQQLLTDGESVNNKIKKLNKYKDSYETLNHQIKAIMEKVLRSNYETDKFDASTSEKLSKFSPEFLEAASYSPVFQPKVVLKRLNLGKLCKIYNINNLHILEDAKRRRGVVGPLSRTLGKRRPILPKKFEDFALTVQDEMKLREEEHKLKNVSKTNTSTVVTTTITSTKPMVTVPATSIINSTTPSRPAVKAGPASKTIAVPVSKSTPAGANKQSSVVSSKMISVGKPSTNATSKPAALPPSKSTPVATAKSVNKANVTITSMVSTSTPNKTPAMTVAKIASEVPSSSKPSKTPSNVPSALDRLVMEWSDSDQSTNDTPITPPFKHLQLPKVAPKNKDLPSTKKPDVLASSGTITKQVSSMSVTKTTVPKPNTPTTVKAASNTSTPVSKTEQSQQKANKSTTVNVSTPVSQKYRHLCGLCNKELLSKAEAEAHVKSHKTFSSQLNISSEAAVSKAATPKGTPATPKGTPATSASSKPAVVTSTTSKPAVVTSTTSKPAVVTSATSKPAVGTPSPTKSAPVTPTSNKSTLSTSAASKTSLSQGQSPKPKPKLMRCKRCQAIVEADQVKSHVCNSVKFNCTICECRFGAKHLLDTHMESTHPSQGTKKPQPAQGKSSSAKDKQRVILIQENKDSQNPQSENNLEDVLTDKNERVQEGYSCFVCDKMFIDEVQMKDHLYMHSDEVSDDLDDKGFQCAFCYKKFQTEESLEAHVGNHLRDDGDEKINMLINLNTSRRERKRAMFRCEICTESFTSAMLLALHMQDHEEEEEAEVQAEDEAEAAATEAQSQQDAEPEPIVCTICDQIFETGDELSEHLDMHNGNAHVCILCEKPFSSIRDLQEHVSTHL